MPRFHPMLKACVFFLFRPSGTGPEGTGFIVARKSRMWPTLTHYYAISNEHMVRGPKAAPVIRLSGERGSPIPLRTDQWRISQTGDDLAAADITDYVKQAADLVTVVPENLFVTPEFITSHEIDIGEEVFMLGMLADNRAGPVNLVSARFGNVSQLADDKAPLRQENKSWRSAHIMDMRSRTGFSGSPVFLYRTPNGDLTDLVEGKGFTITAIKNYFLKLMGVHYGQFPETIELLRSRDPGAPITLESTAKIPSSLTTVVPAWRITELLDHPDFVAERERWDVEHEAEAMSIPVPESASESPTTDENPQHKEDFTRLVSAAARTKPPADRT